MLYGAQAQIWVKSLIVSWFGCAFNSNMHVLYNPVSKKWAVAKCMLVAIR